MDEIIAHTKLLREDDNSLWHILRKLLTDKGIDYSKSYLAFTTEEGKNLEFGVIVTSKKNVLMYFIELSDDGKSLSKVLEWEDISESFENTPYRQDIESVFNIIESK